MTADTRRRRHSSRSVTLDLRNSGDATLPASTRVRLYASLDGKINANSILIATLSLPSSLKPGDSLQLRISLVTPAGTRAGQYHLIATTGSPLQPQFLTSLGQPLSFP
jgi:hypothetical protein